MFPFRIFGVRKFWEPQTIPRFPFGSDLQWAWLARSSFMSCSSKRILSLPFGSGGRQYCLKRPSPCPLPGGEEMTFRKKNLQNLCDLDSLRLGYQPELSIKKTPRKHAG